MSAAGDPTVLDYVSDAVRPDGRPVMGKGVLVVSYACNLKCSFCYAGAEVFARPRTMSLDEAKASVGFLESIGITTFTLLGGEPTAYKHLEAVIRYAASKGMGAWIVSNGVRMANEEYARSLVEAGLKGGCISLHAGSPQEHDEAVRVPGSYDAAMKTLATATARGWPLFPMLTVMDSNVERVTGVVERLRPLGVETVYINYGLPNINAELDTGVDASPQALARMTERLYRDQQRLGVRFIFNREKNKIPLCFFDYDLLKDMFEDEVIGTGCEAAQGNTVVVEPGGTLLGCSHWVEHPLLNIFRDYASLDVISADEFWVMWATGRPYEYRQEVRQYPFEACGDCGWRLAKKCFGGCKVWQSAGVLPKAYDPGPVA